MGNSDIALFDLDGSLADYEGALRCDLYKLRSPHEPEHLDPFARPLPPHIAARIKMIRSQPGWWESLPVIEAGLEVLHVARDMGFSCRVLTKGPYNDDHAWSEKIRWVKKNLPPGIPPMIVDGDSETDGNDAKSLVYGKVLFDDYPPYVENWLKWRPRGLAIMLLAPHNQNYHRRNVYHYNGSVESLQDVRVLLKVVMTRYSGEELPDVQKILCSQ